MPRFHYGHALGDRRRRAQQLIKDLHYSASAGGSGFMHSVEVDDVAAAACLTGPTLSEGAERSIISPGFTCRVVKRLVAHDTCPVPESQLLRLALRDIANKTGPYLAISYADPVARDARSGTPLLGRLYLAAGFFFVGFTSQPRYAVIDDLGALRSTRQGKRTLSRKSLPKAGTEWNGRVVTRDWQMTKIPPARIWVVPVMPWHRQDGEPTSRAWRKHTYLMFWRNLTVKRLVYAQRWVNRKEWRRLLQLACVQPMDAPRQETEHALLARAGWPGQLITRTAAPIWYPQVEQGRLWAEHDVAEEVTSGRVYWPRGEVSDLN